MFTTTDFVMGRLYVLMSTTGVRVLGWASRIDHVNNIIELDATVYFSNGEQHKGRYPIRCAYIETVGDNVMGRG